MPLLAAGSVAQLLNDALPRRAARAVAGDVHLQVPGTGLPRGHTGCHQILEDGGGDQAQQRGHTVAGVVDEGQPGLLPVPRDAPVGGSAEHGHPFHAILAHVDGAVAVGEPDHGHVFKAPVLRQSEPIRGASVVRALLRLERLPQDASGVRLRSVLRSGALGVLPAAPEAALQAEVPGLEDVVVVDEAVRHQLPRPHQLERGSCIAGSREPLLGVMRAESSSAKAVN
mmetsp:Transcript_160575/g.490862  ORF Transcript_160575/g.490862 Transcript_160575/m.490862 type:complete len:227 (+) Transcript_160575:735-1415(+)